MGQITLKSRKDVLSDLCKKGISVAELSRQIGYDRMTVYSVLHSEKPCRFGKSHKVAVALGIKSGEIV
jgi:gp16 family phage-associated protein